MGPIKVWDGVAIPECYAETPSALTTRFFVNMGAPNIFIHIRMASSCQFEGSKIKYYGSELSYFGRQTRVNLKCLSGQTDQWWHKKSWVCLVKINFLKSVKDCQMKCVFSSYSQLQVCKICTLHNLCEFYIVNTCFIWRLISILRFAVFILNFIQNPIRRFPPDTRIYDTIISRILFGFVSN